MIYPALDPQSERILVGLLKLASNDQDLVVLAMDSSVTGSGKINPKKAAEFILCMREGRAIVRLMEEARHKRGDSDENICRT